MIRLTFAEALVGWAYINGLLFVVGLLLLACGRSWRRQQVRYEARLAMDEQLRLETRKGTRLMRTDKLLGIKKPLPLERRRA